MRDIIPRKQQTSRRDIAKGYDRIEAEAGGAARRIYPNTIRDNRRRDGREGELARRREIEGERQARAKPPYARAQTRAGNQIALEQKKEKLRAITRSGKQTRALGRKLGRTVGWQ